MILKIFNACLEHKFYPDIWKKSRVILLPKKEQDNNEPRNCRPICISSIFGKILENFLSFLPGILSEVFDVLKSRTMGMEDIGKDCVLFLDEMEITQGYEHDRSEDRLLGNVTLPDRRKDVANHALVFMLGGLNRRWKQVIAYHLTRRSVDGLVQKDFVFELVKLCSEISLRALVVTTDMGSANRGMWRELGFSSHRNSRTVCSISHPHLNGKQLFIMADNIRGQFNSTVFSIMTHPMNSRLLHSSPKFTSAPATSRK